MIGTLSVKISAGHPAMPLAPVAIIAGSAVTIGVIDVPKTRAGATITDVQVRLTNADAVSQIVAATAVGNVWSATFSADFFGSAYGVVSNGVEITAVGTDAAGGVVDSWVIGVGDLEVIDAGALPSGVGIEAAMHFRESLPERPVEGDVCKIDGSWVIYNGESWEGFGGGGGSVDWANVTGKPSSFPPESHTHAQADVDGLTDAINDLIARVKALEEGGTAKDINLHDETLGVDWKLQADNGEFTWIVKDEEEGE